MDSFQKDTIRPRLEHKNLVLDSKQGLTIDGKNWNIIG